MLHLPRAPSSSPPPQHQLRALSGHLGAAAALLGDLSRAALSTSTALDHMPLSLAANSSALVLPEGEGGRREVGGREGGWAKGTGVQGRGPDVYGCGLWV